MIILKVRRGELSIKCVGVKNNCQEILYIAKQSFNNYRKIKTFSVQQKLKVLTIRLSQKKMLKEYFMQRENNPRENG